MIMNHTSQKYFPRRFAPVAVVLTISAAIGLFAAVRPLEAFGVALLGATGAIALVYIRESTLLGVLIFCYSALVALPAFLPRRASDRESPITTGALDIRALAQLGIYVLLFALACWMWMVAGGGIADLIRAPVGGLMAYTCAIMLSLLYTPQIAWPAYSVLKLGTLLLLLSLLSKEITNFRDLQRLINGILLAILVILVMFWLDFVLGVATITGGRLRTSWIEPNHLTLIAVTLVLVLVVRMISDTSGASSLQLPITATAAATALASASKSALGAAAIGLLVTLIFIMFSRPTISVLARILAVFAGLIGLISYFIVLNVGVVAHLQIYGSNSRDVAALTGRLPIWETAITDTLSDRFTLLLGHGYMSTFAIGLEGEFWTTGQAHNSFIQTFFDLGLVGLILVVFFYITTWIHAIQALRKFAPSDARWGLALELVTLLTLFTVDSLTEDIMGGTVESRTALFLLIATCIHINLRIADPEAQTAKTPEPSNHLRTAMP